MNDAKEVFVASLPKGLVFRFEDYAVEDERIVLHFVCLEPGPGRDTDYFVNINDTEAQALQKGEDFDAVVGAKLRRKFTAAGLSDLLDKYHGQELSL